MKIKSIITAVLAMALVACMFAGCSSSSSSDTEITASDAVNLIKTYTAEDFGVEGELEDYNILSSTENEIDGEMYYKIAIATVSEPEEDGSVDIDIKAEIYVSYDGSKMMQYDEESGEYTEIKDVHDIPEQETVADIYVDEEEDEAEADAEAEAEEEDAE